MAAVCEEQLDPRIQVELEKLNTATDEINKLESKLEDTNNVFSATFAESTARLKNMGKKLGSCIEKARPYYEALELARTSQLECQRAAVQYQRANALHQAAKETIALAEERFVNSRHENWQFDSAWQEMLNHATMKVMEAEAQKAASEREHMRRAAVFQQGEQRVQQLQRGLKSSINKSLVYFEEKARVESQLESQKERVQQLQEAIAASKTSYALSLRRLEQISEQIHEQRRCHMPREPGVGAELTTPAVGEDQHYSSGDQRFPPHHADITQEEKYWESLREKLEKLEVETNGDKCLGTDTTQTFDLKSEEGRERSESDGSYTLDVANGVRVVSGQSSGQESEGSGDSCSDRTTERQNSTPRGSASGMYAPSTVDENLMPDPLTKGRTTPPGSCVNISPESESPIGPVTECRGVMTAEDGRSLKPGDCVDMSGWLGKKHTANGICERMELNMAEGCCHKLVDTDELKIIDLEDVGEVYEDDGDIKEEGDGCCSPPPTPCKPNRSLTVIVEELEHCVLPE